MYTVYPLLLTALMVAGEFAAATCDLSTLKGRAAAEKARLQVEFSAELARDLFFQPNLDAYAALAGAVRTCQRRLGQAPDRCAAADINARIELTPQLRYQRMFSLLDDSANGCRDSRDLIYFLRSLEGKQLVGYYAGYYSFSVDALCTARDGVEMTRGMMIADGAITGKSQLFILDYGIPFRRFNSSQFWGLSVPIGAGETIRWQITTANQIEFAFSNGARVLLDGKKGFVSAINFLNLQSVNTGCFTDHNANTGLARNYWPVVDVLPDQDFVSGPPVIVKN